MHASQLQAGRDALAVRLLGDLRLVRNGEDVELPASKKTRALLGYLVATGEPQRREWLCDLLWEGPDDPRAELRWSLSKIRPLVDEDGTVRLRTDRLRVAFDPAGTDVDLVTVRELLSDVSQAPMDTLKSAVALFRGEFLEGLDLPLCYRFQGWCSAERERVSALRIAALKALIDRLEDCPSEALVHARALVTSDPLSEEGHATVIRLLGRLGRRHEALAQYEQACNVLRRELGAAASSALERARCTIRAATAISSAQPSAAHGEAGAPARPASTSQASPGALSLGSAPHPGQSASHGRSRLRLTMAAAAILLLLAGAGVMSWSHLWETWLETASSEQWAFPIPEEPSLAVLPFASLDGDAGGRLMSQGLTESLVNTLASNPSLFVIAHSSASAYAGRSASAREVAEELGVRYVLEGSVRRASHRVRVMTQLIDAHADRVLWSERYDRTADDLLALEEEITARIAHSLDVRLIGGTQHASGGTRSLDAWAAFVQGRNEYSRLSRAGNRAAQEHYLRAVELDPDYAQAMVALARTYLLELFEIPADDWERVLSKITHLMDEAERIAPRMPQLFELRSLLALAQGDHDRALAEAEAMAELDPNGSESHYVLGRMYVFDGQYERAINSLRAAERLNPHHSAPYLSHLAFAYLALDEIDVAVSILERVVHRWPNYRAGAAYLAIAYQLAGREAEARRHVALLPRFAPDVTMHTVELRFAPMQDRQAADRFISAARQAGIPN